jgi:putative Mg2+ transporter-C (MgtC) family protein
VAQAIALTVFVLAANTLLRPLVNAINRIPLDEQSSEMNYDVTVSVDAAAMADLRDAVVERLEAAQYPVGDVEAIERADGAEIVARLTSTAVDAEELDAVVAAIERMPGVRHATWASSTED